jgi:hypothetical protein
VKTFGVVRLQDHWTIIAGGKRWGRFAFCVDAEEAALRLAGRAVTDGYACEVLVQGVGGEMRRLKVA